MVEPQEFEGSEKALDSYFSQLLDNETAVQETHDCDSDANNNDRELTSEKPELSVHQKSHSSNNNSLGACANAAQNTPFEKNGSQFFAALSSQIIVNRLQRKIRSLQNFDFESTMHCAQLVERLGELDKDLKFYYRNRECSQSEESFDSATGAVSTTVCCDPEPKAELTLHSDFFVDLSPHSSVNNPSLVDAGDAHGTYTHSTSDHNSYINNPLIEPRDNKLITSSLNYDSQTVPNANEDFTTELEPWNITQEKSQLSVTDSKLLPIDYAERNQSLQRLLTQSFLQTPVNTEASTLTQTLLQQNVATETEQVVATKVEPVVDVKVEQKVALKTTTQEKLDLKTQDKTALAVRQAEIMLAKLGVNLKETTSIADQLGIKTKTRPDIREYFEWAENGRPKWAQKKFDIFLFEVNGVTMAVPLVTLGQIYKIGNNLTPIFGQANWMMGIMQTQTGRVKTIDTSLLLMPERYNSNCKSRYRFVITIDQIPWGFAVDKVDQPFRLDPASVNWRSLHEQRPWFAGMIKEKMCTLIDIPNLGKKVLDSERKSVH